MPNTNGHGGFASMEKSRVLELASLGGRTVQASGKGRRWDVDGAREAGRKGGLASAAKKREQKEKNGGLGGSTETI